MTTNRRPCQPLFVLLGALLLLPTVDALAKPLDRRNALYRTAGVLTAPFSGAATADDTSIDMEAINAARNKKFDSFFIKTPDIKTKAITSSGTAAVKSSVIPTTDPPPLLSIRGGKGDSILKIPRVGYSFYKTAPDQVARCTTLALLAGVRHLDVGTQYGTNAEIAKPLKQYLNIGISGLDVKDEKPQLLELLKATSTEGDTHVRAIGAASFPSAITPPPDGSIGRKGRRDGLFIHYKLGNGEQSVDATTVKRAVKASIAELGCTYLDMVSIHSPVSNKSKRLATYAALLELRNAGFVKSVGVCNYGLGPLQEIQQSGMELPAMNQLEISPFSLHQDVVDWCNANGVAIGCSAWSKLSSTPSIQDAWLDVVGGIAKNKGTTKAQVLVRWAMQKGYACVPRSAAATKVERVAIAENSYGGVSGFVLTDEEMKQLDGLNVSLKAGSLGRRDGWEDADVTGDGWDPTDFV